MENAMKSFDQLLAAIGLSTEKTSITVTQGKYKLVYTYDSGGSEGKSRLRIILNPEVTATILRGAWDAADQVDGRQRGPNLVQLGHWNALLSAGGRAYSRKSIWYSELAKCETDLFVRFDHDSDALTSRVLRTMDVVMASLQGYL